MEQDKMVKLVIDLPQSLRNKLKSFAAANGISIRKLIIDIINEVLKNSSGVY